MGFINIVRAPISLAKSLIDAVQDERRVRCLLAGGAEKAWKNIVPILAVAQAHYRTPAGASWVLHPEYVLVCRFLARYPNSEAVVQESLTDSNPYVCAYAIQALCRLAHRKRRKLHRRDFPETLFSRTETIQDQVFSLGVPMSLGELATEEMKPRPRFFEKAQVKTHNSVSFR